MSLEESIAMHERWLHSMQSNHAQIVDDLAQVAADLKRVERAQAAFAEHMVAVGQNQALFVANLARLSEEGVELKRELRELRELVDRYIRFRGNGNPPN